MKALQHLEQLVASVASSMGVTPEDGEFRKSYLDLRPEDAALLRELREDVGQAQQAIMDAFYDHLLKFDETRGLLQDPQRVERLKRKQWRYLADLTAGKYDWDYITERLRVGVVHQQIGLEPRWYIGAYSKYLCGLIENLPDSVRNDPARFLAAVQALLKIVFLDIGLVLETYFHADRQSLAALKEYAESIVCNVPAGLLVLDEDLRILSANRFVEHLLGEHHQLLRGRILSEVFEGFDLKARAREVIQTGAAQRDILFDTTDVSGRLCHFRVAISPMQHEVSLPTHDLLESARLLVIFEDLTEQERLRLAERDTDIRMRSVVENIAEGIVTIDQQGTIESFNRAASQLFGYLPKEVIGQNVKLLMPEPYSGEHDHYLTRYVHSGERRCLGVGFREVEGLRKDGSVFAMELSISEMFLGERRVFTGIIRDISERKAAEQALRDSEERLRRSQRYANIGTWDWHLASGRVYWSDRVAPLFGLPECTVEVRYEEFLELVHADDRPGVIEAVKACIEDGVQYNIEHRMVWPDGTVHWMQEQGDVVRDPEGRVSRVLGLVQDVTRRKLAEHALLESEGKYRALMENASDAILLAEWGGRFIDSNRRAEELLGYPKEELLEISIRDIHPEEEYGKLREAFLQMQQRGSSLMEHLVLRKDGTTVPVEVAGSRIEYQGRTVAVGIFRDISERRRAQMMMAKLSSAVEQTADSIIITDNRGVIEYVNAGFEATTGYTREQALGSTPRLLKSGMMDNEFYDRLWKTVQSGGVLRDIFVNRKKDGSLYYEEKTITPLRDETGRISHFVSSGKDITERMRSQQRMQYLAHHDALTKLPNRLLFLDRLTQATAQARRHGRLIALLFMDLDRFKTVNDTLGHHVGDQLLQELSKRLRSCLREGDTVARLSGDEFAILLDDIGSIDEIAPVAQKLLERIARPFTVESREIFITTSIGIALFPDDGPDPQVLLKHADVAMYRAKALGRNTYRFYTPDMNASAEERFLLENELRRALERDEFRLYYQPQVMINDDRVSGVEALIRWNHSQRGMVLPSDFIPLLEDTGLIIPVGEWVLRAACTQLRRWRDSGLQVPRVAVNIAPRQLADPAFPALVQRVLTESRLEPSALELEITESSLMEDETGAIEMLEILGGTGVCIAMDDFGTGYSSLSYLRRFPIRVLKIDREFVRDVPGDPGDCKLARAIIAMGQSLNLKIIAEGVETADQLAFLREHGCDGIQGYFLAPPLPADELEGFLLRRGHG